MSALICCSTRYHWAGCCLASVLALHLALSPASACEIEIDEPLRMAEVVLVLSVIQERRPECVLESPDAEPWIFVHYGRPFQLRTEGRRFESNPHGFGGTLHVGLTLPVYEEVSRPFSIRADEYPYETVRKALIEERYDVWIDEASRVVWIIDLVWQEEARGHGHDIGSVEEVSAESIVELYEVLADSHGLQVSHRIKADDQGRTMDEAILLREDPVAGESYTGREAIGLILRTMRDDFSRARYRNTTTVERHFVLWSQNEDVYLLEAMTTLDVRARVWDERIQPLGESPPE